LSLRFREPTNGLIHLVSAVFACIGIALLLPAANGSPLKLVSVLVYGISLVLLFSASTIYHLVNASNEVLKRLRKFDHAAIYLLIAGTYTPVCLNLFNGGLRWGFLAFIWTFALAGIIVKIFIINAPRWVTAGIYLVMGWMAVLVIKPLIASMLLAGLIWMLTGGLLFSIGAGIYITKKLDLVPGVFGFHEIWHIFVTLACICHFVMIYQYVIKG
jgi:hemolysin III